MPSRKYSIGSSTVMMLRRRSLRRVSAAYSVVVLPEPVGPVTSMMPCGRRMILSMSASVSVAIGLDADVRGILFHGLGEQGVDEPDDGRVVLALEQVLRLGQGLRDAREIHVIVAEIAHDVHGLARAMLIGLAQLVIDAGGVDGLEGDGRAEIAAHLGQRRGAHVRAAPDDGAAVVPLIDQHAVTLGVGERQPPPRRRGGWRGGGEFVGLGIHRGKIDQRAFGGAISNGGGKSRISSCTGITGTSSPGINATPFCCISNCRARMKLYLPDDTCARRPSSRMMSGCRHTLRFVLSLMVVPSLICGLTLRVRPTFLRLMG